ncbi:unnamed protein product [Caenorhabditis sp. 36 PRJEB53466]|nr:unnamed protein product [Caenorhabditis sp. 36 PRJEB53466]
MSDDDELTCFYNDDHGQNQGPFPATTMLQWCQKNFFSDHHQIRFTDNGMRVGKELTLEKTLRELKERYGEEKPIPTHLKDISFRGFSIQKTKIQPMQNLLVEPNDESSDGWESDKEDVGDSASPLNEMFAGPDLPLTWKDDSKLGKMRTQSTSSSVRSEPYSNTKPSKSRTKSASSQEEYRPFYDGHGRKRHIKLKPCVALELVSVLQRRYLDLSKGQRAMLFLYCSKWNIPDSCKVCNRVLKHMPNYLSHILSSSHITKSDQSVLKFTFYQDYLPLKEMFDMAVNSIERPCSTSRNSYVSRASSAEEREVIAEEQRRCS